MNDDERDDLLEEMGYTICPIVGGNIICDNNCNDCKYNKEFIEYMDNRYKNGGVK